MGSGGSRFNAFDLTDPGKVDSSRGLVGAGQWGDGIVHGYWGPKDASLPDPVGKATIVGNGCKPNKYFLPNTDSLAGSQYAVDEQVNLLKQEGEMWLVERVGSGGAAWVRAKNIRRTE